MNSMTESERTALIDSWMREERAAREEGIDWGESESSPAALTKTDVQRAIEAALARDREGRSRASWRLRRRLEAVIMVLGAIWASIEWPWALAVVVPLGFLIMATSENRVTSAIGRWAWRLIGLGLYVLACFLVVRVIAH